jgi:histidinol-phosphate/aromatic aminotransferase/cobyric acid decarboxylase-like protein
MQRGVSKLKDERAWMIERLRETKLIRVHESDANFILACTDADSRRFCAKLRLLGFSVRNIGDILDLKGCVRITVGTRSMNEGLLTALNEVMTNEDL